MKETITKMYNNDQMQELFDEIIDSRYASAQGIAPYSYIENAIRSKIGNIEIELNRNSWQVNYSVTSLFDHEYWVSGVVIDDVIINITGSMYYGWFKLDAEPFCFETHIN